MKFEITILGSGSALPTLTRRPSAHFVNCNERYILIDCGEGTQLQLRKYKIKFQKIEVILISHLHGDHFFGLVGLISTMNLLGRVHKLVIIGPVELEQLILPQLSVGGAFLGFELEFRPLVYPIHQVVYEDNVLDITTIPLKHRIDTHGFIIREKERLRSLNKEVFDLHGLSIADIPHIRRGFDINLENGTVIPNAELTFPSEAPKRYAYCSDTVYRENLIEILTGVDLLYHEATFLNEHKELAKKTFHTTATQVGVLAAKANVKKVVIGHFSSRYADASQHIIEVKENFEEVVAAEEGMVIRL
jgi:ribonuclease Z